MNVLDIVLPPLVGAVIGCSTNYLAIKMLFRPLRPVMIGRFRVPFTPGIVPRRKNELAGILGKAIVDKFWGSDDLEVVFMSDSFKNAVADRVAMLLNNPDTKLSFLASEQESKVMRKLKDELCVRIQASILKSDLSKLISEQGVLILRDRFGDGLIASVLTEKTISAISVPLAEQMEKYMLENGRALIMPLIEREMNELSREPVSNIINQIMPDGDAQRDLIGDVYVRFMNTHVRPIVESIDVGGMITDKVRQLNAGDIESLVLAVVRRELRFVVWLGAFIGAVIGAVNIFI